MPARKRRLSSQGVRPDRSRRPITPVNDLHAFADDLKKAVDELLPTRGRRFDKAAILAIEFSVSDIPSAAPQTSELLSLLQDTYNWTVVRHTVDCTLPWQFAHSDAADACSQLVRKEMSRTQGSASLLCVYFSGHGFVGSNDELNVCGSFDPNGSPAEPYLNWTSITQGFQLPLFSKKDHRLCIMDCCAAGLANLEMNDVEVIGASAWESAARGEPSATMTRAIIDELKSLQGAPIATTQLISRLYSMDSVGRNMSMPIHKHASADDRIPATIHRIGRTESPGPATRTRSQRKSCHVIITVKVAQENTVPNAKQWAEWLKRNLPDYIGDISIEAKWLTESAVVAFLLPVEIWLSLPARDAYSFVDYHRSWDAARARQRQLALLGPPPAQQQQLPHRPGRQQLQENVHPRTGTVPQQHGAQQQTSPLAPRNRNRLGEEPK